MLLSLFLAIVCANSTGGVTNKVLPVWIICKNKNLFGKEIILKSFDFPYCQGSFLTPHLIVFPRFHLLSCTGLKSVCLKKHSE